MFLILYIASSGGPQFFEGHTLRLDTYRKYTDLKENQMFLTYKEIQNGAVAKSYMTNGLLIHG
jgi:hypothetical protein